MILSLNFLFFLSCGGDPILDRAEELSEGPTSDAAQTATSSNEASAASKGESPIKPSLLPVVEPPKQFRDKSPTTEETTNLQFPVPGIQPGEQPTLGVPEEPLPGVPAPPRAVVLDDQPEQPSALEQIEISGVILVQGWNGNEIRIDIFDGDQRQIGGNRPSVISSSSVNKPGAYKISIPKGDGKYWIGAYVDQNGDGRPGKQDPSGWYLGNPISASQPATGIELVLSVPDDPIPK